MSKQRLFNELSVNLSYYRNSESKNQFICPICLAYFDSINELSEAHIIPKAFGGRIVTLACKKCNSSIGSSIEVYEIDRAKFNHAFSGSGQNSWKALLSPVNYEHNLNLGNVTAEVTFIEDEDRPTFHFKIIPKAFSPKALDEIKKLSGKSGGSIKVETQVRGGWNRAKLTYLHAAYLFLFSQLGYEWVLSPCTQVIRDQIQNPEKELIPFEPIKLNNFELSSSMEAEASCSWYMIVEPSEAVGFLVVFLGLEHWNSPIAVWMPFPGGAYKQMPEVLNLRVKSLPIFKDHLSSPKFVYLGLQLFLQYFFD